MRNCIRLLQPVAAIMATVIANMCFADLENFSIDNQLVLQWQLFNQSYYDINTHRSNISLKFESELYYHWNNEQDSLTFIPFIRLDQIDNKRTHVDIRELAWIHVSDTWELRTGIRKVFWGVTESRHLVDIINQTDLVESIAEEDKLGQPMINLSKVTDWGIFDFFILPGFRERTFSGKEGRLRPVLPINTNDAMFESGAKKLRTDFALRWQHNLGDWEWGVHYFHGTSREPRYDLWIKPLNQSFTEILALIPDDINIDNIIKNIPDLNNINLDEFPAVNLDDYFALVPVYDVIDQVGLDAQYIYDGWVFKLELISRSGQDEHFTAAVFGLEYTQVGVFGTAADLGWIVEYQFDDRKDAAPHFFERDIFLGYRLAFNNIDSTELLLGVIWDPETTEKIFGLEFSHRLKENLSISAEARLFQSGDKVNVNAAEILKETLFPNPDNKTWFLQNEDFLQIELRWYF